MWHKRSISCPTEARTTNLCNNVANLKVRPHPRQSEAESQSRKQI